MGPHRGDPAYHVQVYFPAARVYSSLQLRSSAIAVGMTRTFNPPSRYKSNLPPSFPVKGQMPIGDGALAFSSDIFTPSPCEFCTVQSFPPPSIPSSNRPSILSMFPPQIQIDSVRDKSSSKLTYNGIKMHHIHQMHPTFSRLFIFLLSFRCKARKRFLL
jgi:hypothetical protein